MFSDLTFIIIIPFLFFSIWAQNRISSSYKEYKQIESKKGRTGEQVATELLAQSGITDVTVEKISGVLTDNYDPRHKKVNLSEDIFDSTSIAAVTIAAHEVGHAIQHHTGYTPLSIRTNLLPLAALGSNVGTWLFILGGILMLLTRNPMANQVMFLGVLLFSAAVSFQLLTLPVEYNASKRAIDMLKEQAILEDDEIKPAKDVLSAAVLTYVATTIMSITQLFRFVYLFIKGAIK